MGRVSAIEWTDATWSPWVGCTKASPGCRNCYAERIDTRFGHDFSVLRRASERTFRAPMRWTRPRMIFTCSMSDFFHEAADEWREEAWEVIRLTPRHTYQILTKRPECIPECLPQDWGNGWENVWLGTSVEMQEYVGRATELGEVEAAVRFLSCEPLLGPLYLIPHLEGNVGWAIVGGESDPTAPRPMSLTWVRSIRDQCQDYGVPVFVKQLGTAWARSNGGKEWKGEDPSEWPEDLRIREMPDV